MATIEPRLIHLLNGTSSTPQLPHADLPDLPPLHTLPPPASAERPLPPIDLDTHHRPSGASAYPLRTLPHFDHSEPLTSHSRSFNDLLDKTDDVQTKKRGRHAHTHDDFVQLPQPMKRQRSAQQAHAMPPIINGLLEPPPHAALFPPMASISDKASGAGKTMMPWSEHTYTPFEDRSRRSPGTEKVPGKSRKRATKPRKKWSEEETKHLLLGVNRHGVGKWTSILEDSDFTFNGRTAGDLKDRFRTCCPKELRSSSNPSSQGGSPRVDHQETGRRPRSGLHSENILIEEDSPSPRDDSEWVTRPRKSRAHRKKLQDLADLGILGPFKKSHRRVRHPFRDQDDREILEGLRLYGPAWTKIQRDARFSLSTRQPTDLRDRVRNKYPNIYQSIEKGTFHSKDVSRGGNVLEPSVDMSIDGSLTCHPSMKPSRSNKAKTTDEPPTWPPSHGVDSTACNQPTNGLDLAEAGGSHLMGGEMDISKLFFEASKSVLNPSRHGAEHSPASSSPPPPLPSRLPPNIRSSREEHGIPC